MKVRIKTKEAILNTPHWTLEGNTKINWAGCVGGRYGMIFQADIIIHPYWRTTLDKTVYRIHTDEGERYIHPDLIEESWE